MYVYKNAFDKVFGLTELINNNFLKMEIYFDNFYMIQYNEKMYDRFIKISKLSYTDKLKMLVYNDKIKEYIKIIKYSKKNNVLIEEIYQTISAKELSKEINKHILNTLMLLSTKKINKM